MRIYVPPSEEHPRIGVYDIIDIVQKVSREKYGGNVVVGGSREIGDHTVQLTIEVADTSAPGAFSSTKRHYDKAACWHAVQDVLEALYGAFPDASVSTGIARYRNADQFHAESEARRPTEPECACK
jgi:hypothetical protein